MKKNVQYRVAIGTVFCNNTLIIESLFRFINLVSEDHMEFKINNDTKYFIRALLFSASS